MRIGNIQEFKESQMGKVLRRREEEKQIKKGIYQVQMMIDCQNAETLDEETKKSRERTESSRTAESEKEPQGQEHKKTDIHTEMKKMMSVARQIN